MSRWDWVGLRGRIFVVFAGLVGVTIAGGAVMIGSTYRVGELLAAVIELDVKGLQRAGELENELLLQKGSGFDYLMDGDEQWLTQLEAHRREFDARLQAAKSEAVSDREQQLLARIDTRYADYLRGKDQVIALYRVGEKEKGEQLHRQVRSDFFVVLDLLHQYAGLRQERVGASLARGRAEARRLRLAAAAGMAVVLALGVLLAFILVSQVLNPIRLLARETALPLAPARGGNEISDLKSRVRGLMRDADHTRSELARSRERLFQTEKMAVIGKLAADVAHSIRNPMTSIKMRLFSLERSLELSANQKEDFEVVAEEMRRLDNIVRNFLEFSRPPKLRKQKVDVTEIIDQTIQLLQHRIELSGVEVDAKIEGFIPRIDADPELLKEVLVNFIVNACEAMKDGGRLIIRQSEAEDERCGPAVRIEIADTGPGVGPALQEKVFEPFFSTKEDGTGLGLSIALRIIDEHGGRLDLESGEGRGAAFIITLPVTEDHQ